MHLLSVPSRDPPLCVFLKKDQGPASLKSASPNTVMFWGTAEEGFNYEFGWEGTHFRPEHITVFLKIILYSYHFFPQVFKQWELSLFCHCYSVAKYVDSLQPHGLQHGRLLCPPLLPRVCSNLCHLVELVNLSNHLILCCPLLLLLSIFASIRVFSNELALHIRWPKCWSYLISLSNNWLIDLFIIYLYIEGKCPHVVDHYFFFLILFYKPLCGALTFNRSQWMSCSAMYKTDHYFYYVFSPMSSLSIVMDQ